MTAEDMEALAAAHRAEPECKPPSPEKVPAEEAPEECIVMNMHTYPH